MSNPKKGGAVGTCVRAPEDLPSCASWFWATFANLRFQIN